MEGRIKVFSICRNHSTNVLVDTFCTLENRQSPQTQALTEKAFRHSDCSLTILSLREKMFLRQTWTVAVWAVPNPMFQLAANCLLQSLVWCHLWSLLWLSLWSLPLLAGLSQRIGKACTFRTNAWQNHHLKWNPHPRNMASVADVTSLKSYGAWCRISHKDNLWLIRFVTYSI